MDEEEIRFWEHVDRCAGLNGYWLWSGPTKRGVGVHRWGGGRRVAHRLAYELVMGEVLEPTVSVLRSCNQRLCVNPRHVVVTSRACLLARRGPRANVDNQSSGRRGVHAERGRWRVNVRVGGRLRYLGTFDTVDEADAVARAARAELFGEPRQ